MRFHSRGGVSVGPLGALILLPFVMMYYMIVGLVWVIGLIAVAVWAAVQAAKKRAASEQQPEDS